MLKDWQTIFRHKLVTACHLSHPMGFEVLLLLFCPTIDRHPERSLKVTDLHMAQVQRVPTGS